LNNKRVFKKVDYVEKFGKVWKKSEKIRKNPKNNP
jgi:hypothetical protein